MIRSCLAKKQPVPMFFCSPHTMNRGGLWLLNPCGMVVFPWTGGLADSVTGYDMVRNVGTGFSFKDYNAMSFLVAVVRALELYKNKREWEKLVKRSMSQ